MLLPVLTACAPGLHSYTKIICNLWDAWNPTLQPPISRAGVISSQHGEFASHHSPPGARCELLLANAGRYEFTATHAHIDAKSSLRFLSCASLDRCEPVMHWSGVAWNVAQLPIARPYVFTVTATRYLKIVLEVAPAPTAGNTFQLRWDRLDNQTACLPCPTVHEENDDVWAPYVEHPGCGMQAIVA